MNVAKVIIDLSLDKAFDYLIPEELKRQVHVGVQVHVPFGRGKRRGYVLNIVAETDYDKPLKEIRNLFLIVFPVIVLKLLTILIPAK